MKKIIVSLSLLMSVNASAGVVIVNALAPELTKNEIIDIYMGRSQTFSNGEKIELLQPLASLPVRKEFELKIVSRNSTQMKALWTKLVFSGAATPPVELSEEDIVKKVKAGSASIGYIADKSLLAPGTKVVLEF